VVDGSFSVQATAVSKATGFQEVAVGKRNTAVLGDLFHDRVWRLYQTFVPEGVLLNKGSNFFGLQLLVFVTISLGYEALPKLVFVYRAGSCKKDKAGKHKKT
jgi:hypothetical protein